MKYRTEGKPAPGELVVLHGFLNTWSRELDIEDLGSTKAAGQWLRDAGLWRRRAGPTDDDVSILRDFRSALRELVLNKTSDHSINRINGFSRDCRFAIAWEAEGRVRLESADSGISRVVGTLVSLIYSSVADGTWTHFKCCELETCGWAFYDYSKNHTGRWCSMKTCGSRYKARLYLERKRAREQ